MSQNSTEGFDPNDPIGTWRTIRDANLDAWAKSMASFVNTDVFAKAIGMQLDTLLAATAPVQKTVHEYMETYLAQVNMPSRAEVVNLASRLTNIEMRLDDMQAQLDEILAAVHSVARQPAAAPAVTAGYTAPAAQAAPTLSDVDIAEAAPEKNGAPKARSRTRKPAVE